MGLGNPGRKYKKTRHNIGFIVLERLAISYQGSFKKGRFSSEMSTIEIDRNAVILAKPLTFMNNSGMAVAELMRYYDIEMSRLLIIYDDVDIPFSKIRIRGQGTAGGHKGVESVIQYLKSNNFARLRIGINSEHAKENTKKFVLSKFSKNEQNELEEIIQKCASAAITFINEGIENTMNEFN